MHRIEHALQILQPLLETHVPRAFRKDVTCVLQNFGSGETLGRLPGTRAGAAALQRVARGVNSTAYSALSALYNLAICLEARSPADADRAWADAVECIGYAGASDADADRLEAMKGDAQ